MVQKLAVHSNNDLPIGVFDSGVGGLTVLAALAAHLPQERLLYLGDTARLPYGTKSPAMVAQYALQATAALVHREIKCLVIACNTATAAALPRLRAAYPHLPVVGVIEPGAAAAVEASSNGRILVLATESTIQHQAYQRAILALKPQAQVSGIACSLFVALVEEGWAAGFPQDLYVAEAVARRYLSVEFPFLHDRETQDRRSGYGLKAEGEKRPDCIVLGCTHFPPLAPVIAGLVGQDVRIVDSAATTARAVAAHLAALRLLRSEKKTDAPDSILKRTHFMTTDGPERFARVGSFFLGVLLDSAQVELIAL